MDRYILIHNPRCSKSRGAQAVIEAILSHPKILERPIVLRGTKGVIGRPPEQVLEIL